MSAAFLDKKNWEDGCSDQIRIAVSDGSAATGKNATEPVQFGAMVDFMWLEAATISEPWHVFS